MILSSPPDSYGYYLQKKHPWIRGIQNFRVNPKAAAHANLAAKEPELGRMIKSIKPVSGVVPKEVPQMPKLKPEAPIGYNPGVKGLQVRHHGMLPGRRG